LTPLHLLDRVDAPFGQGDQEKVLRRAGLVANRNNLAAQRFQTVDIRSLGPEEPDAAAMHAGGDADVESLLEWLQPTERHSDAGVGLAGRNRLQQLLGRTAEIDEINIEVVLGKNSPLLCYRGGGCADGVRIPSQL
jgi:hypothetical protein